MRFTVYRIQFGQLSLTEIANFDEEEILRLLNAYQKRRSHFVIRRHIRGRPIANIEIHLQILSGDTWTRVVFGHTNYIDNSGLFRYRIINGSSLKQAILHTL